MTNTDENIVYPVYASDYLDISNYNGNGSVAGIIDSANHIIVSYKARYTYEEAKAIVETMNQTKSDAILKIAKTGTAKKIRI